ncbi:hypothetical protein CapIbe_019395 [Capra ibex]
MLRMRMRGRGPVLPGTSSPAHCWEVSSRSGKALAARLASRFQTLRIFHRCLLFSAIPSCALGSQPQTLPNTLVTFGSILGYKRRGGVLSLIAGLFIGFLAGYGAYRVSNDKRDVKLSLFTAFFLTTMMGVRFKRSKKIMPAGLVAGLSLLMILRLQLLLL